jgi:hypothetical protein
MSTRHQDKQWEISHMRHLIYDVKIPLPNQQTPESMMELVEDGLLTVSTVLEYAIARMSGLKMVQEDSHDLEDLSDVKYATNRKRDKGDTLSAKISNVAKKIGPLRVQVLERMTGKFYYFLVPSHAYTGKNDLEVPFTRTGDPSRLHHVTRMPNVWQWQVPTFAHIASKIPGQIIPQTAQNITHQFFTWNTQEAVDKLSNHAIMHA